MQRLKCDGYIAACFCAVGMNDKVGEKRRFSQYESVHVCHATRKKSGDELCGGEKVGTVGSGADGYGVN